MKQVDQMPTEGQFVAICEHVEIETGKYMVKEGRLYFWWDESLEWEPDCRSPSEFHNRLNPIYFIKE